MLLLAILSIMAIDGVATIGGIWASGC